MHKKLNLTIVLALLVSMLLAGTVSAQSPAAIQDAANTYFSGGAKNITADALYENLNDGDTSNDPFILSVRKAEHYAAGHIPGAVNISAGALFSEENLATLPTDKQIVVYCYTGQTASQVTSALNMLGYDAANLKFGFGSWTLNADAGSKWFNEATAGNDFAVETEANEATETYDFPTPLAAGVAEAANAYFSGGTKNISAADLFDNLMDGDDSNDPFVLSVRSADHYAIGHVPGAVNIGAGALFTEDNLAKLPTDKQIVVYCYTGQSASQVASVLNMLGYDAANMLYGMQAWTMDTDVRAKFFNADVHSFDYAFEGTAAPAAEEEAAAEEEEAAPEALPETGADPVSLAPVGLVIFGVLSMGVGVVGYAVNRRKSA